MKVKSLTRVSALKPGLLGLAMACSVPALAEEEAPPPLPAIRSVLVLPPVNNTNETLAEYSYLSTVSRPLAEAGYYVFPVVVVDAFMKENGLPSGDEMHAVPLEKLREILGADAVLYVEIEEYGQQFQIINSQTVFRAQARLVDTRSGDIVWQGQARESISSNSGDSSLSSMVFSAVLTQVMESGSDKAHNLTRIANNSMFHYRGGLPRGPLYLSDEALHALKNP